MHNIDRTQLEWENGSFEFEADPELYGESYDELYEEAYDELYAEGYDTEAEMYDETEGVFDEAEEMELAAELLSISNEEELDQFLGKLFKRVSRGIRKVVRSPIFRPLGGMLKGIAKKALPIAGGALGTMIPIPGVGTALGAAAGKAAGKMFGLELEGLSAEDQEFEVARRFVRLAGDAAQEAASAPTSAPPQQVAQAALVSAAQKHAPGLLAGRGGQNRRQSGRRKASGRWIRRGRAIILLEV